MQPLVVYWAVFFIPRYNEKNYKLLGLVNAVMLYSNSFYALRSQTISVQLSLPVFLTFCLGNFIGYFVYVRKLKIQKDQS